MMESSSSSSHSSAENRMNLPGTTYRANHSQSRPVTALGRKRTSITSGVSSSSSHSMSFCKHESVADRTRRRGRQQQIARVAGVDSNTAPTLRVFKAESQSWEQRVSHLRKERSLPCRSRGPLDRCRSVVARMSRLNTPGQNRVHAAPSRPARDRSSLHLPSFVASHSPAGSCATGSAAEGQNAPLHDTPPRRTTSHSCCGGVSQLSGTRKDF